MAGRRSDAEARRTRAAIVARAADVASVSGLEGLRIASIAADVGLSKGGVLGHFATKQELQLATVEHAIEVFVSRVWTPVEGELPGLPRLEALTSSWVEYVRSRPFTGGCFIAAASFEFDDRAGAVHEALATALRRWRRRLVLDAEAAIAAGDLPVEADPEVIAFTLQALADNANPESGLYGDGDVGVLLRRAMRAALGLDVDRDRAAA